MTPAGAAVRATVSTPRAEAAIIGTRPISTSAEVAPTPLAAGRTLGARTVRGPEIVPLPITAAGFFRTGPKASIAEASFPTTVVPGAFGGSLAARITATETTAIIGLAAGPWRIPAVAGPPEPVLRPGRIAPERFPAIALFRHSGSLSQMKIG